MANRPWLEEIGQRLANDRLPPAYIRRFMDELADHFQDITEENMTNDQAVLSRLGQPGQIAEAAVAAYRQRTFLGRHPSARFWVFAVSPLAAMFSAFLLMCLGIVGLVAVCEKCGVRLADKSLLGGLNPSILNWGFALLTTILPAALLTLLYCRFARRFEIGKKWMIASCFALALVAMLPFQNIAISDIPGKSMLSIGLGFPPGIPQLLQLLVPLAVGVWFLRRSRREVSSNGQLPMAS
jgi:hypothetical protein